MKVELIEGAVNAATPEHLQHARLVLYGRASFETALTVLGG
jgi:hypothetical protein